MTNVYTNGSLDVRNTTKKLIEEDQQACYNQFEAKDFLKHYMIGSWQAFYITLFRSMTNENDDSSTWLFGPHYS